jgi:hypothetical protein
VCQIITDMMTSRMFLRMPQRVMTRPEVLPIWNRASVSSAISLPQRLDRSTHQEDTSNVEHKSDRGVSEEHEPANANEILHLESAPLPEEGDHDIGDGADGRIVVQADERIHLLRRAGQQHLDHDQPHSLEDDTSHLVEEANPAELDLAEASQAHAEHDGQDVEEDLQAWVGHAPGPAGEEHSHGCAGLEHLDEGHTQVEVGQVATNQACAVEEADGHDCAQVEASCHFYIFAAVEERCEPGEQLGCCRCEDHVPTC